MESVYFLCDTTHPSFNGAVNTARTVHVTNAPQTLLSVAKNPILTRAVIKVFGGAVGLINVPTMIQAYTKAQHPQLMLDMAVIAPLDKWANPP